MHRSRIVAAVLAVVALFGIALAPAAGAATVTRAAPAAAHRQIGPYYISTENGANYCIGAPNLTAGTAVIQEPNSGGCRDMYFSEIGVDSNDYAFGYWEFSNGNYMAANSACEGVTIKSSSSSNGTVWTEYDVGGHLYLANRYCSQQLGLDYSQFLAGTNDQGDQWQIGTITGPGLYTKIDLTNE
jgi:hypothetical protein